MNIEVKETVVWYVGAMLSGAIEVEGPDFRELVNHEDEFPNLPAAVRDEISRRRPLGKNEIRDDLGRAVRWRVEPFAHDTVRVTRKGESIVAALPENLPADMPAHLRNEAIGLMRFDFAEACYLLGQGWKVRREGWKPGALHISKGLSKFVILTVKGKGCDMWSPYFEDFTATDWQIVQ